MFGFFRDKKNKHENAWSLTRLTQFITHMDGWMDHALSRTCYSLAFDLCATNYELVCRYSEQKKQKKLKPLSWLLCFSAPRLESAILRTSRLSHLPPHRSSI